MKKIGFLLIFALCLVLSGCNKEDEPKYESLDIGYHTWTFKIRVLDKNGEDILKQEDDVKKIKGMLSIEYEGVVYTPKIDSDFAFGDVPLWSRLMIGDPDGSESGQCLYFSRFDVISKYDDTFVINWVDQSKDVIHLTIIAKTKRAEIENEMSKTSLFSLPFFSCIYWDLNNN